MEKTELQTWLSDKLISIIGYSKPVIIQYVIALSKESSSPEILAGKLIDEGIFRSGECFSFAHEVFKRVPKEEKERDNLYERDKRKKAIFVKKQKTYEIIEEKEIEETVENLKEIGERVGFSGKVEKLNKFEKEVENLRNIDEGIETMKFFNEGNQKLRNFDKGTEKVNLFERNKKSKDIDTLRKISRQKYLDRREESKIKALLYEIQDEGELREGILLTEKEKRNLKRKQEIHDIVKKRPREDEFAEGYVIPEAYDGEGNINQERRFAVVKEKHRDEKEDHRMDWEDAQLKKATRGFGSRNRKNVSDDYDFVFDSFCQMGTNFVEISTMDGDLYPDKRNIDRINPDERKALPIYGFRDSLLDAIHRYQIIVIVGEAGCGKTTQIPQYLHEAGYSKYGIIGCTQPRRVAAMSVADRVAKEMGVKLGNEVGYSVRFEDCTSNKTVLKYMTDGMLLRELLGQPDLANYSVLMVDEAHERTVSTDILFGLVKDIARARPNLKLLISSATLDAIKFSDFFDNAPIFWIPGRRFPVDLFYSKAPESDYLDAAIVTTLHIHVTEGDGDILVFLTGQDEIERAEEVLRNRIKMFESRIPELIICPIFGNLPTECQNIIFEPTPKGSRKVVLATNIAETSLTIDGIRYVIDTGFCKIKSFSTRTGIDSLEVVPISKASAMQRAGRAGRTGPGKCFRLYTYDDYDNNLHENTTPEIQRTDLATVVLTLKMLGITDLLKFDFMDPPPVETLLKAIELLYALGALNNSGELTNIGKKMSEFPLNPMLSKAIVASVSYNCSNEIVTLAAMLSVGYSIFYCPKNKKWLADNARKNFSRGKVGDHIALLNVFNAWQESGYSFQWCYDNFVQVRSMKKARDIREQLGGIMERIDMEMKSNSDDVEAVKKAITSGFFTNYARRQRDGSYKTLKCSQTVYIHPTSGLSEDFPKWVIYVELILTSKKFIQDVSEIKPEWLVEIAPHYYKLNDIIDKVPEGNRKHWEPSFFFT